VLWFVEFGIYLLKNMLAQMFVSAVIKILEMQIIIFK